MLDDRSLDEIRRQFQESLVQAKREQLQDQYGMVSDHMDSRLSPEEKNQWLDYMLEFERQAENAPTIKVRERIGNPAIRSIEEIPEHALVEAVDDLLDLLADHDIAVHFLGEWDYLAVFKYITEELLDEEMDDIRIDGVFSHFTATTPAYDLQMWTEDFVSSLFWREQEFLLPGLEQQPLFDESGKPMAVSDFMQRLEAVWAKFPAAELVEVRPVSTQVGENEGTVTAVITWQTPDGQKETQSFFRLQPCPYSGWDVVQSSLLDDMLAL